MIAFLRSKQKGRTQQNATDREKRQLEEIAITSYTPEIERPLQSEQPDMEEASVVAPRQDNDNSELEKKHESNMETVSDKTEKHDYYEKHVHFNEDVSVVGVSDTVQGEQLKSEISQVDEVKELTEKWIHMDNVEAEKLEWMKDCPTPTAMETKVLNLFCSCTCIFFVSPSVCVFIVFTPGSSRTCIFV